MGCVIYKVNTKVWHNSVQSIVILSLTKLHCSKLPQKNSNNSQMECTYMVTSLIYTTLVIPQKTMYID